MLTVGRCASASRVSGGDGDVDGDGVVSGGDSFD